MSHRRRIAAVALSIVSAGALLGAPTVAAQTAEGTAERFAGTAAARALDLQALGTPAVFGTTTITADSTAKALAEAAGQLTPVVPGSVTKAEAASPDGKQETGEQCGAALPPEVPAQVGLDIGLACSSSLAEVVAHAPRAVSQAGVAGVSLNANTLLDTLGLGDPLDEATGEVVGALAPLFGGTPLEGTATTVSDLLDDVLNTETLRLTAGASSSELITDAAAVTSKATAQGAVLELLPTGVIDPANPTAPGTPVATIEVGAATATAVYDRAAGTSKAEFDPAIVRVTIDKTVAAGLGLNDGSEDFVQQVAPGETFTLEIPGVAVLARVVAANGETATLEDGTTMATADAVRVDVLPDQQGGLSLGLAQAQAGVSGAPATAPTPQAAPTLPRTGSSALLPLAGVGLLAVFVAVRRLAAVRS